MTIEQPVTGAPLWQSRDYGVQLALGVQTFIYLALRKKLRILYVFYSFAVLYLSVNAVFLSGHRFDGMRDFQWGIAFVAGTCLLSAPAWAQSLKIALSSEPTAIDPHYHDLTPNNALAAHIFDGLTKQDEKQATYEGRCGRDNARIDWGKPWRQIHNLIRGCNPAPGAWTTLEGQPLQVFEAKPLPARDPKGIGGKMGEIAEVGADGFTVVCADGRIKVLRVKTHDGPKVAAGEFAATAKLNPATRLV